MLCPVAHADLNEDWAPSHGGELRLFPFPLAAADVAPRVGRLALFCSHALLHRVLPARAPRCVLSLWFAGAPEAFPSRYPAWVTQTAATTISNRKDDATDAAAAAQPPAAQLSASVLAFLRRPANARVLCKARRARPLRRLSW